MLVLVLVGIATQSLGLIVVMEVRAAEGVGEMRGRVYSCLAIWLFSRARVRSIGAMWPRFVACGLFWEVGYTL